MRDGNRVRISTMVRALSDRGRWAVFRVADLSILEPSQGQVSGSHFQPGDRFYERYRPTTTINGIDPREVSEGLPSARACCHGQASQRRTSKGRATRGVLVFEDRPNHQADRREAAMSLAPEPRTPTTRTTTTTTTRTATTTTTGEGREKAAQTRGWGLGRKKRPDALAGNRVHTKQKTGPGGRGIVGNGVTPSLRRSTNQGRTK